MYTYIVVRLKNDLNFDRRSENLIKTSNQYDRFINQEQVFANEGKFFATRIDCDMFVLFFTIEHDPSFVP